MCSMMDYFFIHHSNNNFQEGEQVSLSEEESHHAIRVLRKTKDDIIGIMDGAGMIGKGRITEAHKKNCTLLITDIQYIKKDIKIDLYIGFPKKNDRIEWLLEKACECNINSINPIVCEHSERKKYNTDRGRKIIKAACKQSGNPFLPSLNEPTSLKKSAENCKNEVLLAHCYDQHDKMKISQLELKSQSGFSLFIGPEGDFSESEIEFFQSIPHHSITLGELRYRTETAALAGIIQLHSFYEYQNNR